ncbi:ComEC/Rec2 family competence protein [Urechidicola vernalis]|uniref:ComEC/Rec2 family competence protein n=1 Tax=Urechidicola vernalis TaxID=3075600 RepID=A0ABU2Y4U2_9FLAO|nr:ComEC/Rec2 family competence protein [Urechidicola sp. P050]MDT0553209.1 ComEC/Rec2 family competence protein [Urechidicola sp. P050]
MFRFVPGQFCFFLIAGILVGSNFKVEPKYLFPILLILLSCLLVSYYFSNKTFQRKHHFNFIAYALVLVIGITSTSIHKDKFYKNHYSYKLDQSNLAEARIIEVLAPSNYHNKYVVEIESINGESLFGKVLLNLEKDSFPNYNVDNRLFLNPEFREVNKPLNPYYFNYRKYLERKEIYHQVTSNRSEVLMLTSDKATFLGLAEDVRKSINTALEKQGFKENELAVMNALLLGQRSEVSKELLQSYANAGAIHILALSGLHVGIILLLLNFILKPIERLRFGKSLKLILIIVFLWSFAFVAGMSPSIIRAVTMFTAVAIGWQSKRPTNVFHTLVMSMFVLLLFRPSFLFEVGFQLSYLAVYAIVLIQPLIYNIWKPKFKTSDYLWQLLTVSIAAQLGVLPLSLFYFHQFPGLFFLSNLIIIPFLGFILGCGFLVIILSLLNLLPKQLFELYNEVISYMNSAVDWIGRQESFLFQEIPMTLLKMLACYLFLVALISIFKRWTFSRMMFLLSSILMLQGVVIYEEYNVKSKNEWIVFYKSRQSIFGKRIGGNVKINHSLDSTQVLEENILKQYNLGVGNIDLIAKNEMIKVDMFRDQTILIIDSLGLYKVPEMNPLIVVLIESPKVNLERVLESLQPKIIVADGSNYKSYVQRWEETCIQQKTPFHYTGKKGAFVLKN